MADPLPPGLEAVDEAEMQAFLSGQTGHASATATAGASHVAAGGAEQYSPEEWAAWFAQMSQAGMAPGAMMGGMMPPAVAPVAPAAVAPAPVAPVAAAPQIAAQPQAAQQRPASPKGGKMAKGDKGKFAVAGAAPQGYDDDGKPAIIRGGLIDENAASVKIEGAAPAGTKKCALSAETSDAWDQTDHKAGLLAAETWEDLKLQPYTFRHSIHNLDPIPKPAIWILFWLNG